MNDNNARLGAISTVAKSKTRMPGKNDARFPVLVVELFRVYGVEVFQAATANQLRVD